MAQGHNHGGASRGHQQDNTVTEAGRRGVGWPGPLHTGHPPPEAAPGHRGGRPSPRSEKRVEHTTSRRVSATCAGNGPPNGSPEAPHGSAEAPKHGPREVGRAPQAPPSHVLFQKASAPLEHLPDTVEHVSR